MPPRAGEAEYVTTDITRLKRFIDYLTDLYPDVDWRARLRAHKKDIPPGLPRGSDAEDIDARWSAIPASETLRPEIADEKSLREHESYRRNIENYIGTVKVPAGLVGPLRVNGVFASGDYILPLATTEAALVASYNRGARVVTLTGGCTTMLLNEGVSRAPGFTFQDIPEAVSFVTWATSMFETFQEVAARTTQHGKLIDFKVTIEGNHVYLKFDFVTADASGQNMATIATHAVCQYITENSPVTPRESFVESNMSGDKKATSQSFQSVRGRKVTAEVTVPKNLVEKGLNTTPDTIARYSRMSMVGTILSGSIGTQGHYANGLTALYIACGQDAACVAESAVGITRFDTTDAGDLYASVTLPNLMVATVGGGTGLPSQKACLDIIGLAGPGNAHAFAEVAAGLCLAGELSIAAALSAGEFTQAHERLARQKDHPQRDT